MKRYICIALVFLLVMSLASPAMAASELPRLVDNANLLSRSESRQLERQLDEISEAWELDVVVVTVDSLDGDSAMDYADDYFDDHGYGMGSGRDGILLLVAMEEREYWFSTHGYGIRAFTDAGLAYIEDQILPYLSDGDYGEAFSRFAGLCDEFLRQAKNSEPYDRGNLPKEAFSFVKNLLICLVIGIAAAFLVTGIMRSQLKTVRAKAGASDYIKAGSMNLTHSRDLFLYSNVSRVPKPKSNSGSSTHRSSSGASHGGRGGRF